MSHPLHKYRFYMVRHGESEDNRKGVVSSDQTPLTEMGVAQAEALRSVFAMLFPDPVACYLVSSALPRAQHTAKIMSGGMPCQCDSGLNEIHNGVLGGRVPVDRVQAILEAFPERRLFYKGVERHAKQAERVVLAILRHLKECPEDKDPVFVSHFLSMEKMAQALGIEEMHFKNAAMYCFEYDTVSQCWAVSEMTLHEGQVQKRPVKSYFRSGRETRTRSNP